MSETYNTLWGRTASELVDIGSDVVTDAIQPVDIIKFAVIPACIVGIIAFILLINIIPLSGKYKINVCQDMNDYSTCKMMEKEHNKFINISIIITATILIASAAGTAGYKLGFYLNNKRFGAAISAKKYLFD